MIMKANYKQHFCSKLSSNLSTFLPIMLIIVLLSFFFSIFKSFTFLLTIPIALVSSVLLVKLKRKKWPRKESVVPNKLLKEKEQPSLDVSETAENHEEQDEAHLDYSFPLDSESGSSSGRIVGETFEIDHNEYQNDSSHDELVSESDDEDDDYDYDDHGEINRIIIDTNYNLDERDDSLLSYSPIVYPTLDDHDDCNDHEEEEEEDSLIEIDLPRRHLSNSAEESKQKLESKLQGFFSESIYKEQSLMQLLEEINDMNEDDQNLIEIDISM